MSKYRRNHYVPKWYQKRFIPDGVSENKFFYLDLEPDTVKAGNGKSYPRKAINKWGPPRCFYEDDLYTTKFGEWESTEIEQHFFGAVDTMGKMAVETFNDFAHPSVCRDALHALLPYMTVQRFRTPKGIKNLSKLVGSKDKNTTLFKMQELQQMYCAIWTECVWSIADASDSNTKFIISDHPVTVFNEDCFPGAKACRGSNDPDIRLTGTHTLFPLGLNKILILTNLSWVRNPYSSPLKPRPHPKLFRPTIFNFTSIQTGRKLTELEVNEINYIIKKRAYRYIAAAKKEWLYPEHYISTTNWSNLGRSYLLMPDPRSVSFSSEILIGYDDKRADAFDAYGRKPWHADYDDKKQHEKEWDSFHGFKGEYARLFGPKRRGTAYEFGSEQKTEDSPDYHQYHLSLEQRFKANSRKKRRRKTT